MGFPYQPPPVIPDEPRLKRHQFHPPAVIQKADPGLCWLANQGFHGPGIPAHLAGITVHQLSPFGCTADRICFKINDLPSCRRSVQQVDITCLGSSVDIS